MAVLSEWITANVTEKERNAKKVFLSFYLRMGKIRFFSLSLRVSIYLPEMLEKNTHFLQLYLNHFDCSSRDLTFFTANSLARFIRSKGILIRRFLKTHNSLNAQNFTTIFHPWRQQLRIIISFRKWLVTNCIFTLKETQMRYFGRFFLY